MLSCSGLCDEENTLRRAVFLDRDGTLNENRADHVKSLAEFVLLPGVLNALQRLAGTPLAVVVITNQSVINRGLTDVETVRSINQHLSDVVHERGGRLDGIYLCPHRPDEDCQCRKPRPGLLIQAQAEHDLTLTDSYLVGDAATDVELAKATGCHPVLVLTGRGRRQLQQMDDEQRRGVHIARDLEAAVDWILDHEEQHGRGESAS